jgi:putative transposase
MKRSKFSEAQIAFILRQGEEGTPVGEVCRKAGISEGSARRDFGTSSSRCPAWINEEVRDRAKSGPLPKRQCRGSWLIPGIRARPRTAAAGANGCSRCMRPEPRISCAFGAWTARGTGASLFSDKCVRASLNTTAVGAEGAAPQARRHGQRIPAGSNRSAVRHRHFAKAIAARSVDLGCPSPEHAR